MNKEQGSETMIRDQRTRSRDQGTRNSKKLLPVPCSLFPVIGLTLIELVVTIGLIAILFGGIALAYSSILDSIVNTETRSAAAEVLGREIEIIRNLPYDKVGTVGGIPAGSLPQTKTVSWNGLNFVVKTTIRNIDDPFDGTLGGNPNDTAPADYKLAEVEASCPTCARFFPLSVSTYVAPKNLESASTQGSLFMNVFNANGIGVPEANIRVQNSAVSPSVDLTDTTNNSGTLQLVGVPTSTQGYRITVNLPGYSSERTYPQGGAGNPNPLKPDATVAAGTVTQISFAIDKVSMLTLHTSDFVCDPFPNKNFSITGGKLIGASPDVLKYSTSSLTDASGSAAVANLEWDTYAIALNEPAYDIVGTIPFSPLLVNPNTKPDFRFVIAQANPDSLLVAVKDAASGNAVPNASVLLVKSGFSKTLTTGRNNLFDSDWSGGKFSSQSGGIETDAAPGKIILRLAGGSYPTSTTEWLISRTFDVGSSSSAFYAINWNPISQPPAAGPDSAKFQIASNTDNATWNFLGPDGTAITYYTQSGAAIAAQHANTRYLRYKIFMKTDDPNSTPEIDDVSVEFSSVCVPPGYVLFSGLGSGSYSLTATAPPYLLATSSVSVSGAWQQIEMPLAQ